MARVAFAPATADDDASLRRLLAENPMEGRIRVAFEREPSYFHAVEVQGRFAQVIVGRDLETGALVGVGTRTVKPAFVNGEPRPLGYLSDLRLLPAYRGERALIENTRRALDDGRLSTDDIQKLRGRGPRRTGWPTVDARINRILDTIRLKPLRENLAGSLAHGQKQWLEIGMLLAQEPKLLLVDEPVAGMTDVETHQTAELLKEINRDKTVIVVEHDMTFVRELGVKVTCLHEGTAIAEGTIDQVSSNQRVVEVYLGR